ARLDLPDRARGLHQAAEGLERHDETAAHGAAHAAGPDIARVIDLADARELPGEPEGQAVRLSGAGGVVGCSLGSRVRGHEQRGERPDGSGNASDGTHGRLLRCWSWAQGPAERWP